MRQVVWLIRGHRIQDNRMTCKLCVLKLFIALRRAQPLAAALLVSAVFIGALGAAVPAMQAQQAVVAAPAGSSNAVPPPKAETPPPAESTAEILNRIANSGLPERGAHDAKVTIVFFDDFQCPYSAQMYNTLFNDVMKAYGDRVKVIIEPVPNSTIHPWSKLASTQSICISNQSQDAYWDFLNYLHSNHAVIDKDSTNTLDKMVRDVAATHKIAFPSLETCLATGVEGDLAEAHRNSKKLEVLLIPTLFINSEKVERAVSAVEIRQHIEHALAQSGVNSTSFPHAEPRISGRNRFQTKTVN